jgi:muramoyltetrapeptide carboxypeptidase LdcA involved in peptidoglycan recycling
LLVYVEAAGDDAFAICRNLHGMRLAGFFTGANAVLVGRTRAPAADSLTQHEAVLDALGCLRVPIIADVECGHVPPYAQNRSAPRFGWRRSVPCLGSTA